MRTNNDSFQNSEAGEVFGADDQFEINNRTGHNCVPVTVVLTSILFLVAATFSGLTAYGGSKTSSLIGAGPPSTPGGDVFSTSLGGNQITGINTGAVKQVLLTITSSPTEEPTKAPVMPTAPPTLAPTVSESTGMKFTTYREGYSILDYFGLNPSPFLKYKILEGHSGLIEPNANMSFYIFDVEANGKIDVDDFKFSLCSSDNCFEYSYSESFNIACTPLTTVFEVSISQRSESGWDTVGSGFLKCMYVRREMRSLTDRDLEATVNAMYKMWELEEEEGQAIYGQNFHNYARLLEYHYFNAAWQDADHVHEGNGFLPQHLKMDLIFSRSLTAIDPSISLFYWDFTIENATGIPIWESPMFTEKTFGSLKLPKDMSKGWTYASDNIDDGAIPNSKWKGFRADVNDKYDDLYYGYGYMRAPWNMNPANVITRFTSVDKYLPGCKAHHKLLAYSSYATFLHQIPYGAHAAAHGVIGGVFGCDLFDDLLASGYLIDEQAKLNLCKNWIFYLKELYRAAILVPNKDCTSADENGDYSTSREHQNCGFQCVPDMLNILFLQLRSGILNSDYEVIDTENMSDEGYVAWKNFICDGEGFKIFGGDHLESASPADPSFWPIHPTLERLLHAKYMANGFDTDVFPSDPINEYVCNKQTCYDPDHDNTDDARSGFGAWSSCCYGHYGDDQLMDAPSGDRYTGVGPTNYEIMAWNNPAKDSYAMDYIYDGFTWDHCAEAGYNIVDLLTTQYEGTSEFVDETFNSEKGWR